MERKTFGMEKLTTCKMLMAIVRDESLLKDECRYHPHYGKCDRCPSKEVYTIRDVPDLIKKGYHTLLKTC